MAECKNYERNMERCTCQSEDCERKGYCCECIAAHQEGGSLPSCLRTVATKDS